MKVPVNYVILIVIDSFGEHCVNVVNDLSETIQTTSNLRTSDGKPARAFESEAFHLRGFCEENNFSYFLIKRSEKIEPHNTDGYYKGN